MQHTISLTDEELSILQSTVVDRMLQLNNSLPSTNGEQTSITVESILNLGKIAEKCQLENQQPQR